jgi:hypothetical protein
MEGRQHQELVDDGNEVSGVQMRNNNKRKHKLRPHVSEGII